MTLPKISVVTINYNMGDELAGTIESVLGQDYPNLEYIVIDGGSTDSSVEVIKRYPRIDYWISERDKGRYYAMNKGVQAAAGEWVIFINSGDRFHDPAVVTDVFKAQNHAGTDLVYGHVLRRYPTEDVERVIPAQELSTLPLRMPCSHQSLFARRTLLLEHPFSPHLSIAADHDFMLRAMLAGSQFKKVERTISIFATGGISDRQRFEALHQILDVLRRLDLLTVRVRIIHATMMARALFGARMKQIIPRRLTAWILKHKTFD
ncbi:MAG: glycosyltransferase [Alphaproteobacteria bacterium]|nr:glycosyltransferase [Alphaproteobacteria bacterium]